jgi:tetratricopeptide (TPR) repeat protein
VNGGRQMSFITSSRLRLLILSTAILPAFMAPPPLKGEDQRIVRALACMDYMLYDEAISQFELALQTHPMERGLRVKQAFAYFRLNKYEEAVGVLNREHGLFPDDLNPLILLGFIQHASGQPDDALMTARAVQAKLDKIANMSNLKKVKASLRGLFPNAGLPAYLLGLEASKKRDSRAARAWFLRAQDLSYDATDCWLQSIYAEMEAGHWPEALKLCGTKGNMSLGEEEIGGISAVAGKTAVPPKNKIIVTDIPSDVFMLKAIILAQLGRQEESRVSLEEAVAAEPFRTDLLKNVAIDDMRRADFEKAARVLTRVVKLSPLDFQARFLLEQARAGRRIVDGSSASIFSREFMKARGPRFLYVLEGRPNDVSAVANGYALQYIQLGLLVDAANHLRAFTEIYTDSPTIYYNLGQLSNTLGRFAEALACGARAIVLKDNYAEAHDLMGNVYFKIGDFENAARSYEKALLLNIRDPLSYYNLACAYHELGDDMRAERNWLEAIRQENAAAGALLQANAATLVHSLTVKVEPVSALSCQYLGLFYAGQGKTGQAIEYFERAIAYNPNALVPYLELGRLYNERNEGDKAGEYLKKYLELGGDKSKVTALSKKTGD